MHRFAGALVIVLAAFAVAASADDKPATPQAPARVETRHAIALAKGRVEYRAIVEAITLTDAKGTPTAAVYTVSYLSEPASGAARPVAFVFNGGPGAASVFLHLGALGPRIMDTPGDGSVPKPPYRLVDNPASWLAFTDLVFVDPVGTGFSHGTGKEDNPNKPFWGVRADLDSLSAVVRRWLNRHERWGSPVYLVGESYGGYRAAAMAKALTRNVGVTVSGMVLVSPALDTNLLHREISNLLAPAFALPSYAAAAAVAGKAIAPADSERVERFALGEYLGGLAAVKGVPPPGDPFISRIVGMIGLPEDTVRRYRGRVPSNVFARELRREQGQIVSSYDAAVARATPGNPWDDAAGDPVLDEAVAAYTAAFNIYAPESLGYRTESPYRVLPREVSRQWNWDAAKEGEGGLGLAMSSLEAALLSQPATKVLIVHGRTDLVTPYLASRWLVDQLSVPAPVRARIQLRVYEGGHMMYMRPRSLAALSADAAALFAAPPP